MNRIKMTSLCLLATAIGMTACNKEEATRPDREVPFSIESSISALVRAPQLDANGGGEFSQGDQNTLFLKTAQTTQPARFIYTHGNRYHWEELHLPANSTRVTISACYPTVESPDPEQFDWDVVDRKDQNDILLATPVTVDYGSENPVRLTFRHALHQLKVVLRADGTTIQDDALRQATIACRQFQPVARLNLMKGLAVSASGEKQNLEVQQPQATFLIPAQPVATMELLIRLGNREVIYPLASCQINGAPLQHLESGKSLTLTIEVSDSSFTITSGTINGWESQGEINGSISI